MNGDALRTNLIISVIVSDVIRKYYFLYRARMKDILILIFVVVKQQIVLVFGKYYVCK